MIAARLTRHARRKIASLVPTVVVYGGALDHCMDNVMFRYRVGQPPENDHSYTAAEDRAGGPMVKCAAVPIG